MTTQYKYFTDTALLASLTQRLLWVRVEQFSSVNQPDSRVELQSESRGVEFLDLDAAIDGHNLVQE